MLLFQLRLDPLEPVDDLPHHLDDLCLELFGLRMRLRLLDWPQKNSGLSDRGPSLLFESVCRPFFLLFLAQVGVQALTSLSLRFLSLPLLALILSFLACLRLSLRLRLDFLGLRRLTEHFLKEVLSFTELLRLPPCRRARFHKSSIDLGL